MSDISHEGAGFNATAAEKGGSAPKMELPSLEQLMAKQVGPEHPTPRIDENAAQQEALRIIQEEMKNRKPTQPDMSKHTGEDSGAENAAVPQGSNIKEVFAQVASRITSPFKGLMNLIRSVGRWIAK